MDASHSNLNIWLILLVSGYLLAPANAQTTKPLATPGTTVSSKRVTSPTPVKPATSPTTSTNTAAFHDPKRLESAPEPPPALRQVSVEFAGTLVGPSANPSIEFVLSLRNNSPRDAKILDPLDSFSLLFSTISRKPIPVPKRVPRALFDVKPASGAIPGAMRNVPYPAPVQFRRIVRGILASYQKEQSITIPAGGSLQIVFTSEPVVMERVFKALRDETGEGAKSFKAEAFLALINDPPSAGGRTLYSDPVLLKIPSL